MADTTGRSEGRSILQGVALGALIGGILGAISPYAFNYVQFVPPWTGALAGIAIGGIIVGLITLMTNLDDNTGESDSGSGNADLRIHEERMDITRNREQLAQVKAHREVSVEERNITVPVIHEDLVIEKQSIKDKGNGQETVETVRIPLREEKVVVDKQPVDMNEVSIRTCKHTEIKQVGANLKKEKVRIRTIGNPIIHGDGEGEDKK